ncbi:hypothetical protein BDZ45DRAFT_672419 [Acephala macrosclerotiorum]|nr:hypothetical protein BDZ45DRAFT_672419 [Acephala macrosclerotiorum]
MQSAPLEPLEVPNAISEGYTRDHIRRKIVSNTRGTHEKLDSRFRVQSSDKFKPGHVSVALINFHSLVSHSNKQIFKVVWSEPRGENSRPSTTSDATDATTDYWVGRHGEEVYSSVRRFVIVATDFGHSQCLPILTYKHQATTKGGVKHESHAIIYTGPDPPLPLRGESLILQPVQMVGKTHRDVLLPESRINYAKIYTVEHNVKVFFIGWIAEWSQRRLLTDFDEVWSNKLHMTCEPKIFDQTGKEKDH